MSKKYLILAALIVIAGLIFFKVSYLSSHTPATTTPHITVIPTIVENKTSLSNGEKQKLTLNIIQNSNNTMTYTVIITDTTTNQQKQLFTTTVDKATTVNIPLNSWAPDNNYFFITEKAASEERVLVFKTSGEPFANGQQYADATAIFAQKKIAYTFKEATGWAAPLLLIVTTTKDDGTRGPSFWFETDSQNFIQLAR